MTTLEMFVALAVFTVVCLAVGLKLDSMYDREMQRRRQARDALTRATSPTNDITDDDMARLVSALTAKHQRVRFGDRLRDEEIESIVGTTVADMFLVMSGALRIEDFEQRARSLDCSIDVADVASRLVHATRPTVDVATTVFATAYSLTKKCPRLPVVLEPETNRASVGDQRYTIDELVRLGWVHAVPQRDVIG